MKKPVRLNIENRVAHIILDNPPDNKMDMAFFKELKKVVDIIKANNRIGSVIIYGSARHFSSGADVEGIEGSVLASYEQNTDIDWVIDNSILFNAEVLLEIENLGIPVIAAINGLCVGAGLELALACDIRIASEDSLLGLPEITWELIPGCSGTLRLGRLVGRAKALQMILTGSLVNGREAYSIGIANNVLNRQNTLSHAITLARRLAETGPAFKRLFGNRECSIL